MLPRHHSWHQLPSTLLSYMISWTGSCRSSFKCLDLGHKHNFCIICIYYLHVTYFYQQWIFRGKIRRQVHSKGFKLSFQGHMASFETAISVTENAVTIAHVTLPMTGDHHTSSWQLSCGQIQSRHHVHVPNMPFNIKLQPSSLESVWILYLLLLGHILPPRCFLASLLLLMSGIKAIVCLHFTCINQYF